MSILRQLCDEAAFKKDPASELFAKALLVRQAGLEHLVTDPSVAEVAAMALAGRKIANEERAKFAALLKNPSAALAEIDGGATLARETITAALDLVRSGGS